MRVVLPGSASVSAVAIRRPRGPLNDVDCCMRKIEKCNPLSADVLTSISTAAVFLKCQMQLLSKLANI